MASETDVRAIALLEQELFSDPWSEETLCNSLNIPHYALSVCVNETGNTMGYLIAQHAAGEAELLRIGVSESHRGLGIGSALMKDFFLRCAERETPSAFLEVRQSNAAAIALYHRFGFATVGRRKNYYHDPTEDACLMAAELAVKDTKTPEVGD